MTSPRPPPPVFGTTRCPGATVVPPRMPLFFTPAAPLSPDLLLRIRTDQGRPGREYTETAVFASPVSSGPGRPLNGS